jgi:serine/threonine protein phosphatase 1
MFLGSASPPSALRVYAIGDVHGRLDCLEQLFDRIKRDVAEYPVSNFRIVMLGDYVDRGPQSSGVLEFLCALSGRLDIVFLRGNHDDWLLEFIESPEKMSLAFLEYGGWETLNSYGIGRNRSNLPAVELSRLLTRRMPARHKRFLAELGYFHIEGDYYFCHAGVRPGIALDSQDPRDLIWIRGEFLDHVESFGKVIVQGHTPELQVDLRPNRINIDTMAFRTGKLTCLVLEGVSSCSKARSPTTASSPSTSCWRPSPLSPSGCFSRNSVSAISSAA